MGDEAKAQLSENRNEEEIVKIKINATIMAVKMIDNEIDDSKKKVEERAQAKLDL